MEDSPFDTLPREIRNHILLLALHRDLQVILVVSGSGGEAKLSSSSTIEDTRLSPTKTCRQMHKEGMVMFIEGNQFEIVLRTINKLKYDLKDNLMCGSELWIEMSIFRDWMKRTMNKHHAFARSFDMRLGRVSPADFKQTMRELIAREVVRTVHLNPRTKWTISLEIACHWPRDRAGNPFGATPDDKWWLPNKFKFDRISLTDEVPEVALGSEKDSKQKPGWPHLKQYRKEEVSSEEVCDELPRRLAAARELMATFMNEIQHLMREQA